MQALESSSTDDRRVRRLRACSARPVFESQTQRTLRTLGLASCVFLLLVAGLTRPARSACNLIPQTTKSFHGTLGVADRPYGIPGEWVSLHLDPVCHGASSGFTATAADHVVTLIFVPLAGSTNVVVLANDCPSLEAERAACEGLPEVSAASCIPVSTGSPPLGLAVVDRNGTRHLSFRFPDTAGVLGASDPKHTLVGSATIAVTTTTDPLPCDLAAAPCTETTDARACIDGFYESDGSCGTAVHRVFGSFTALPVPNDYRAVCVSPPGVCDGTASDLRLAADADGNLLIPVDWRGILVRKDDVPVPRLLRAATSVDAFGGLDAPITLPNGAFVDSYTPEGGLLPPIFDPQTDPTAPNELVLFGSADAPETVLRIARRSPTFQECAAGVREGLACTEDSDCGGESCVASSCYGGTNNRLACTADSDCPGGECGLGLFELRDRFSSGGIGPIVVPRVAIDTGVCEAGPGLGDVCPPADCGAGLCVDYRIEAQNPVPLEGIAETNELFGFVLDESVTLEDLNGDGDTRDYLIDLRNHDTGESLPIAVEVSRTHQPPFGYPALEVEGNVAALLQPDTSSDDCPPPPLCDLNVDGDYLDAFLRVYRDDHCCDLSGGTIAAETEPEIDDKAVALSDGMVFYRRTEWMDTPQRTRRVSVDSGGTPGVGGDSNRASISANGRYVAFASDATNLVAGDTNSSRDTFVHDTQNDTTERISVDSLGGQSDGPSFLPRITPDGNYVVFQSSATNLVAGDLNGASDVFVHNRSTGVTVRVSVDSAGVEGNGLSFNPTISDDGLQVAFQSDATNLVAGDSNGVSDVFVHDRTTGNTERVSVTDGEAQADAGSGVGTISAGGRFVAFGSASTNLVGGDTNGEADCFLRDRVLGTTERVSLDWLGGQLEGVVFSSCQWWPWVSADGRFVVFTSSAINVVPGDDATQDVYVRDRKNGTTTRVSVDSGGAPANNTSTFPHMSSDGRYVVFTSFASNLGRGPDTNGVGDVFIHDIVTGVTEVANLGDTDAAWSDTGGILPAISPDGRFVAFENASATNLVAGGVVNQWQIYVRGLDDADLSADLSGDGDVEDTILEVLDARSGPPATRTTLCPSGKVTVSAGQAAFLRAEDAGATPSLPDCPTAALIDGNPDLNGDGDAQDEVVHFWSSAEVVSRNLGLAATDLAMSPSWIGALISECQTGGAVTTDCKDGGSDLNNDGDAGDDVLYAHEICNPISACASWTIPTIAADAQAADYLEVAGSVSAIITPEQDQGGQNLNGFSGTPADTDTTDRVVQVFDASTGIMTNVGQAAEELVLGEEAPGCDGTGTLQLVAFRTSEQAQGGQILNNDPDAADDVLQVYDVKSDTLVNPEQALLPCRLEACDPRRPYRVAGSRVRFLTFEPDQGEDLDGDGATTGLVLQSFDFCTGKTVTLSSVSEEAGREVDPLAGSGGGETSPGATDGEVFLTRAGRCLEIVSGGCTTNADCESPTFCDSTLCRREQGVCISNADCAPGSTCEEDFVVATDTDADRDGVPDSADNCPEVSNGTQTETLGGNVGDACFSATCGNDTVESIEDCDGTADAACPGACRDDCTCTCANVPSDPKAKVIVKAKRDNGVLSAKLAVALGAYNGEAVAIRLDDSDSAPIAVETSASVPPRGKSGKKWLYKQRNDGIRKILIKDRTKKNPGEFLVVVKSKRWFSAAAADRPAAETTLTLTIGSQCFGRSATKKVD